MTAARCNPGHLDWLRDLIAIHHARSIQYYAVFEDSLENASELARRYWRQYPEVLDAIAASRLGLPAGEAGSRERAVQELHRPLTKQIEDGVLFRVLMEYRYRRTRHWLRGLGVEILTPSRGEFVVGDIPALTVRKGMPGAGVNAGIGYALADAIILPIAPDFLLRVVDGPSRYAHADGEEVSRTQLMAGARCLQPRVPETRKRAGGIHPFRGQAQAFRRGVPRLLPGLRIATQAAESRCCRKLSGLLPASAEKIYEQSRQ